MTQYKTPVVAANWAESRETHAAVATAIHAIADNRRTPEQIWENPTQAEWDHVTMAVQNYIENDLFTPEDDGRCCWGLEAIEIPGQK